jgi:hypothetical protein
MRENKEFRVFGTPTMIWRTLFEIYTSGMDEEVGWILLGLQGDVSTNLELVADTLHWISHLESKDLLPDHFRLTHRSYTLLDILPLYTRDNTDALSVGHNNATISCIQCRMA